MITFIESLYPYILGLHIGSVIATVAVVVATDLYAFIWVIGKKETLDFGIVRRSHNLVWAGLIVTIIAGFLLFLPYASYLLSDFAFKVKMLLIVFLVVNALVIGQHMHIACTRSFASLTLREKLPLIASGFVSTSGWIGSIIAAQFIGL